MSSPPVTGSKRKRSSDGEEKRKAKAAPNLVGPQTIVTVNVSSPEHESQPFRVHKNYICYYSPYFETAFNGAFVEGETQVLDLYDTDPTIFGIFVNWLYAQTIINEKGQSPSCDDCVKLWILGDRILAPKLQNHALAALNQRRVDQGGNKCFTPKTFLHVWNNTTEDSMLRTYLVSMCVEGNYGSIRYPEHYPHGMLVGIINAMRENGMGKDHCWKPSAGELKELFVPEDVEGRKMARRKPPTRSGGAPREESEK